MARERWSDGASQCRLGDIARRQRGGVLRAPTRSDSPCHTPLITPPEHTTAASNSSIFSRACSRRRGRTPGATGRSQAHPQGLPALHRPQVRPHPQGEARA